MATLLRRTLIGSAAFLVVGSFVIAGIDRLLPKSPAPAEAEPPALTASQQAIKAARLARQGPEYLAGVKNEKTPPAERLRMLSELQRSHPDLAKSLPADIEPRLIKLTQAETARAQAVAESEAREFAKADAKRRKQEGVLLGMNPDQVLASSWGKPQHINRTTSAAGVREQWVYGGHNYLYFQNGRLVSIQN